ncbi:tyrosine--tRNA ligase [Flaviaesturariibacter flavus]|uniref:Tyrosine--tRNA ligase n=1 Tax=Flaviaesturariibacter flavus TaxID=2502780 RepID=A0A4R1BJQ8_9BACT|nr:tyrosine--tRNA ligase [Flaviaesturariibacter flavus]TCJ17635.1 tyrosine--tRNA ligase [Flaviaesturariibacter flavus]
MNLIDELRWRGMIQDIMPGTEEQLKKEPTAVYIGFDPTADSLHIGSLVPILLLVHLQRAGHKPVALVGGATGMIGDPSFKSAERHLLDEETLQHNVAGIRRQLEKFLDFSNGRAELVNNYDWFKGIDFLSFIRDVGKHISINYMMSKDSVRKRLESDTGISFTEFTYQLIQGYDFYWLYQNKACKVQAGGSDQWGNITTGTELIRRKAGGEAFAFTCPLIKKADGTKFGKTEQGNVWLDPEKTSPYQFYQFWLNATDTDAENWIKIFTFLDEATIEGIVAAHRADPGKRLLQKRLAEELTVFVHGQIELEKALETTQKLFTNASAPAESLSVEDLEGLEGIVKIDYERAKIAEGVDVVSFLAETGIFPSKGEARKLVQGGGVSINRNKVADPAHRLEASFLLHNQFLLVNKGKKNVFLVRCAG